MVAPFNERLKKMNPYPNKLLFAAVGIAALLTIQLFASNVSAAGPSLGFPPGKPYYGSSNQRASQSARRSRPMYRNTAPVIVRTESAPSAVAQAPTEERRFSYEPSQHVQAGTPCPEGVVAEPAPATAERPTRTYRSFSYEPGIEPSAGPAVRTYSRPMRRDSQKPAYLLPKTDPRKYRTHDSR
jgi:hypothetical protein